MATGKSGVPLDVSKAILHFEIGEERHLLFENGEPADSIGEGFYRTQSRSCDC